MKRTPSSKLIGFAEEAFLPSIHRIWKPAFRIQPTMEDEHRPPPQHYKKKLEWMVN
jgi:hypothetical protein